MTDASINDSVAVMAYVAPEQAVKLAVSNGEPPEDLHVTLAYLANQASAVTPVQRYIIQACLSSLVRPLLPVTADVFARAEFNFDPSDPEREPCSVILVQSDELATLYDNVQDFFAENVYVELDNSFPIWVPHITLGYNVPISRVTPYKGGEVTFDRIKISWGGELVELT